MRWIAQNHTANLMWHINPYMVFFTQQDTRVRERLALRDNRELSWQDPESLPNIARTRFSGRSAPSNSSSVECFKSAVCQCPSPPHLPGTSSLMRMLTDPDTPPLSSLFTFAHTKAVRENYPPVLLRNHQFQVWGPFWQLYPCRVLITNRFWEHLNQPQIQNPKKPLKHEYGLGSWAVDIRRCTTRWLFRRVFFFSSVLWVGPIKSGETTKRERTNSTLILIAYDNRGNKIGPENMERWVLEHWHWQNIQRTGWNWKLLGALVKAFANDNIKHGVEKNREWIRGSEKGDWKVSFKNWGNKSKAFFI